jgi:hypothetical protein
MTRCICYKSDGSQCTRETSTKAGQNPLYCWQHQKCAKSAPSTEKKTRQTTEKKLPNPIGRNFSMVSGMPMIKPTDPSTLNKEEKKAHDKFYKKFWADVKKDEKEKKKKAELIYNEWKKNDDKLPMAVTVYAPSEGNYGHDHTLYPHPKDKQLKSLFKSLVGATASTATTAISQFEPKFTIVKDYGKSKGIDLCMVQPDLITLHVNLDDTIKSIHQG